MAYRVISSELKLSHSSSYLGEQPPKIIEEVHRKGHESAELLASIARIVGSGMPFTSGHEGTTLTMSVTKGELGCAHGKYLGAHCS